MYETLEAGGRKGGKENGESTEGRSECVGGRREGI